MLLKRSHPLLELESLGFTVQLEGDNLRVKPSAKITDEIREFIRDNKREIVLLLRMLELATVEQIDQMIFELDERIAIITEDPNISEEEAQIIAEQDCLAKWL